MLRLIEEEYGFVALRAFLCSLYPGPITAADVREALIHATGSTVRESETAWWEVHGF